MAFARRLANVETIPQQDSAERALNKLARTFTTQIEALKRYRSTGQQKVTVEHVTVQAGGQAILGNVSHGTPANDPGQPTVPLPAIAAPDEAPLTSPGGGWGTCRKGAGNLMKRRYSFENAPRCIATSKRTSEAAFSERRSETWLTKT